jgi:hypothetical protein
VDFAYFNISVFFHRSGCRRLPNTDAVFVGTLTVLHHRTSCKCQSLLFNLVDSQGFSGRSVSCRADRTATNCVSKCSQPEKRLAANTSTKNQAFSRLSNLLVSGGCLCYDYSNLRKRITSMKRTWSIILGILLLATLGAQAQFNDTTNADGITVTIIGYSGPGGAVTIPATITGLPVAGIGNGAFQSVISLTNITIPAGVTSIGDYAFYECSNLTSVEIPGSVASIGDMPFMGATA